MAANSCFCSAASLVTPRPTWPSGAAGAWQARSPPGAPSRTALHCRRRLLASRTGSCSLDGSIVGYLEAVVDGYFNSLLIAIYTRKSLPTRITALPNIFTKVQKSLGLLIMREFRFSLRRLPGDTWFRARPESISLAFSSCEFVHATTVPT